MAPRVNFGQSLADVLGIKVSRKEKSSFNKVARAAKKSRSGSTKRSSKGGGS